MLIRELLEEINDWQDSVFTKATPLSAAIHLEREAIELVEGIQLNHAKEDIAEELADIFFLLAGVSHLAKIDLVLAVQKKFEINKSRTWGKPDAEGVVEHIQEEPDPPFQARWYEPKTGKIHMRLDSNGKPYGIGRAD